MDKNAPYDPQHIINQKQACACKYRLNKQHHFHFKSGYRLHQENSFPSIPPFFPIPGT